MGNKVKEQVFNIRVIIDDLKETTWKLEDYLRKHDLLLYQKEIEKAIYDAQEIGQCESCGTWCELGELYDEGTVCEGCHGDDE